MKRRDFLKTTPAFSLPFLLNGMPLTVPAASPLLQLLSEQTLSNGKVLVMIQLNGGNDGLNTLLPLEQYNRVANARSNIMIPANRALRLDKFPDTAMHPSMPEMQNLFNNGLLNVVQGVGYANPNFSHFRAADIWFTGSAPEVYVNTGWLGRAQELSYPGYPVNYPTPEMPDPLTVQIGSQASLSTQCTTINTAVTVTDPNDFYKLITGIGDPTPILLTGMN